MTQVAGKYWFGSSCRIRIKPWLFQQCLFISWSESGTGTFGNLVEITTSNFVRAGICFKISNLDPKITPGSVHRDSWSWSRPPWCSCSRKGAASRTASCGTWYHIRREFWCGHAGVLKLDSNFESELTFQWISLQGEKFYNFGNSTTL